MKKAHKIIIPVFAVLLAGAIALVVLTMNGTLKKKPTSAGEVNNGNFSATDFAQLKSFSVQSNYPYMQSDFNNIFYSADTDGNIKFYEFKDGKFADYSGTVNTVTLQPECSYNVIPIKISYIVKDGKTCGYGLFTNKNTPQINLYSYVFAKLTDIPAVYGIDGKMLLLNTNPDEAYCSDKTYTEIFTVDMTTGACTAMFSQRDRNIEKSGKMAERWNILTDGFIKSIDKKAAFISGRLYNEGTKVYDAFDINRSINTPEAKEIFGTFLRENKKDGGYIYLKKTSSGFKSVKFIAQEEEIVRIDSDIEKECVFSGDWVYTVKDKTFTNLVNGTKITADGVEAIDMFAVNSDGSKIVAVANYENQAMFVINKDGSVQGYSGDNFFNSNIKNICFADNNTVMTTATNKDGTCINYLTKIG